MYVVYNDKGEEIEEIGALEEDSPYANSIIMNAADYNHYIREYQVLRQNFEDFYGDDPAVQPELLTQQAYQDRLLELTVVGSDTPGDWQGDDATHSISPFTASVLVLPEAMLYTAKTQYLLGAFPIDLTLSAQKTELDGETQSIILSAEGKVLYKSKDRIAHRSIFYEDLAKETTDAGRWNQSSFTVAQDYSKEDLKLVQPVSGVAIVTNMPSMGGDTTDSNGQFNMAVRITPCPLFSYEMPIQLEAQIPYRPFNPELSRQSVYYLTKAGNFICNGYGPNATSIVQRLDFPIDVNMISGQFDFPNVALATEADPIQLEYDFKTPELDENAEPNAPPPSRFTKARFESYDFDLDGQFDRSVCGNLSDDADKIFTPVSEAEDATRDCRAATVQGIYLSGSPNAPYTCTDTDGDGAINPEDSNCQPQFTRLVDTQKISEDIGLVIRMATAHLQDTDLFIIRQATGQLVSMRQGLQDSEDAYGGSLNDIAATQDQVRANFRMLMRGPDSHLARSFEYSRLRDDDNGFSQWQQNSNMAPEFQKLDAADQVRTGEQLQLYAINRVTGYIGSASFTLEPAQIATGRLDTVLPSMEMLPPNLKIWAERTYEIEAGLTKGDQRRYLIGNEGVGEADDTYIQITVQWLDQDGSPLPAALSNYGYTGRLAYVSGSNTLADSAQTGQARFAIEPGTHVEVVRLSGGIANQHYYLQVNAVPAAEFDDFGLAGDGATPETQDRSEEATFKEVEQNLYRPERFVPFKTPQYSEQLTELQTQAYLIEKRRREEEGVSLADMLKPQTLYNWFYRPDYQFSVYDLDLTEINLVGENPDTGEETLTDIKPSKDPKITGASIVDILYDLTSSDQQRLEQLDGDQTLVLAIGQQETNITLSANNTIRFDNLNYLNQLGSDDYLTIAIYTNEDSANLLYEYAFGRNGLHVYYKIPHDVLELLGDENFPQTDSKKLPDISGLDESDLAPRLVRTLGGMRLNYRYQPPVKNDILSVGFKTEWVNVEHVDWKFDSPGYYCTEAGVMHNACKFRDANATYRQTEAIGILVHLGNVPDWSVWWEPALPQPTNEPETVSTDTDWTLPGNKTKTFLAQYKAELEDIEPSVQKFVVQRRMVSPKLDADDNPMAGSDVLMLEQLLWQLGLSPQQDNPGSQGARIASNRSGSGAINTTDCRGELADNQNTYYKGRHSESSCATGKVSLEQMIRRFQGRSIGGNGILHRDGEDGYAGKDFYKWLSDDWVDYATAYSRNTGNKVILSTDPRMEDWLDGVIDIWNDGLGTMVVPTYDLDKHNEILASAGIPDSPKTQKDLVRAWKSQESPIHWGTNNATSNGGPYQATPYRMMEGGADNYGSLSFSQVMYQYNYSEKSKCPAFSENPINLYDPEQNVKAFAIFTGMTGGNGCATGPFKRGLVDGDFTEALGANTNLLNLYGYRHGTGAVTPVLAQEGTYEVFAKSIGLYNGKGELSSTPWAEMLMTESIPTTKEVEAAKGNSGHKCFSCKYTIQVRNQRFGLPFRQYIWVGEREQAQVPDPDYTGTGTAPKVPNPNAGDPSWCFAFGEGEWIGGTSFNSAFTAARGDPFAVPLVPAVGRINCTSGE